MDGPKNVFPLWTSRIAPHRLLTAVCLIRYVSFPLALAAAIGLEPGDEVQWKLLDRTELHLLRVKTTPTTAKSNARKS